MAGAGARWWCWRSCSGSSSWSSAARLLPPGGQLDPSGPVGPEVTFTIPTGSSATQVASLLSRSRGSSPTPRCSGWYPRFKGQDSFFAGDYVLNENMAAWDVLAVLEQEPAPIDVARFTVPEGLTLSGDPGAIVDDIPSFRHGRAGPADQRGAQLPLGRRPGRASTPTASAPASRSRATSSPSTYEILPGDGEVAALQRMADEFDRPSSRSSTLRRPGRRRWAAPPTRSSPSPR